MHIIDEIRVCQKNIEALTSELLCPTQRIDKLHLKLIREKSRLKQLEDEFEVGVGTISRSVNS